MSEIWTVSAILQDIGHYHGAEFKLPIVPIANSTHSKALVDLLTTSLILQVTDHGVQLNTCRKLASQHWLFLPVM